MVSNKTLLIILFLLLVILGASLTASYKTEWLTISKENNITGYKMRPHIVLFKNVVAGDYSVLHILDDGQVEFTSWNRLHQITSHKRGYISRTEIITFFRLMAENGFYQMEMKYDIYPLPPDDTKIYEDVYFVVKVRSDEQEKIVLTHEQAIPTQLKEIVVTLLGVLPQAPELPRKGNFIMVGDHAVLQYKRFRQSDFVLHLSEQNLNQYSLLKEALRNPYTPISIGNTYDRNLSAILNEKQNNIEITLDGERFDVILLKGEDR